MAVVALFGILLWVFGTAFLYGNMNPTIEAPAVPVNVSGEVTQ